jgi:isoquinoline 1-oxidoreductase alpha subunit
MVAISLKVNGKAARIDADPETPLLWLLRDHLGLTGTKYGCGVAQCGACTVHLNGAAVRSCQVRAEDARGASVTTIEGLSAKGDHMLQRLWAELNVPQCGYCQTGMIMAAADLLKTTPKPSHAEIDAAMTNICRCGTYPRVRAAIRRASGQSA